ncbi:MAG: InlB B-repeat-containing protein [Bifidobacterium adolescentis]
MAGDPCRTTSTATVTAPVTLYAQWTVAHNGHVRFDQGGSAVDTQLVGDRRNRLPLRPILTRTGYTFAGWRYRCRHGRRRAYDFNTAPVTGDLTLYAQWTPNTYTVTFDSQRRQRPSTSATGGIRCKP